MSTQPQQQPKMILGCLTVLIVLLLVASLLFVRSLNPLAVYATGSMTAKVIVSILLALTGAILIQFLGLVVIRAIIATAAGRPADDVICPGCGNPLIAFVGAYGAPVPCPQCRTLWHVGPACFARGLPSGRVMGAVCPNCRKETESERDLYHDLESL